MKPWKSCLVIIMASVQLIWASEPNRASDAAPGFVEKNKASKVSEITAVSIINFLKTPLFNPNNPAEKSQNTLAPIANLPKTLPVLDEKTITLAAGPGLGGGGLICQSKLEGELQLLVRNLQFFTLFKQDGGEQYIRAIKEIEKKLSFVSQEDLTLNLNPRDAVNYPYERVIVFDKNFCSTVEISDPVLIQSFLLHEILRKLALDDTNRYKISSAYYSEFATRLRESKNIGLIVHRGPQEVYLDRVVEILQQRFEDRTSANILASTLISMGGARSLQGQHCLSFHSQAQVYRRCLERALKDGTVFVVTLRRAKEIVLRSCDESVDGFIPNVKSDCLKAFYEVIRPLDEDALEHCQSVNNPYEKWICLRQYMLD